MKNRKYKAAMGLIKPLLVVMALAASAGLIYASSGPAGHTEKTGSSLAMEPGQDRYSVGMMRVAAAGIGIAGTVFLLMGLRQMRREAWLRYY